SRVMRWILALVLVVGLAFGGAVAGGLISFGGGEPAAPGPGVATASPGTPAAAGDQAADAEQLRPANHPEAHPVMQLQAALARLGFSPGVIDGREGMSLTTALRGFQRARRLTPSGHVDEPTRAALAQWDRVPSTR